ncbi:hypothetical protein MLD38_027472 [Melastoma candidum]|uniref:Uncharacterized protein n=1 Tax=Melastoma candidum TaxID=119954 RepID=A0ACB9P2D0_9MYRT|nr:hypothetical protein MLD38_027472 [Melastoma candidum]
MVCQVRDHPLVQKVTRLYEKISSLDDLRPSKDVDALFTQLVLTCIPPSPIDVTALPCPWLHLMRSHLIKLCGQAESLLESHFSTLLGDSYQLPIHNLQVFPYYSNYINLARLEFSLLKDHLPRDGPLPRKVAFVGSGPLPLSSIVLARDHLTSSIFYNYDIDPSAASMAKKLVSSDPDLSQRVLFRTSDIFNLTEELGEYDVVFLAALVGLDKEEKVRVVRHLVKYMKDEAMLMARSAHGARAFLYPVLEPSELQGFKVLSVHHPSDEVINSVVVARKCPPLQSMFLPKVGKKGEQVVGCNKCSKQFCDFDSGNNRGTAIDSGLIL